MFVQRMLCQFVSLLYCSFIQCDHQCQKFCQTKNKIKIGHALQVAACVCSSLLFIMQCSLFIIGKKSYFVRLHFSFDTCTKL